MTLYSIQHLPEEERPRERLMQDGGGVPLDNRTDRHHFGERQQNKACPSIGP